MNNTYKAKHKRRVLSTAAHSMLAVDQCTLGCYTRGTKIPRAHDHTPRVGHVSAVPSSSLSLSSCPSSRRRYSVANRSMSAALLMSRMSRGTRESMKTDGRIST
eukprot:m.201264 g.201264  ORF g.201264 m.201264 type:complete len:104 (+) comp25225_c0_seq2:1175-1486(+)